MKLKKLTVIALLIVLFVSQITWITFNNYSNAAENVGKFHYDQLEPEGKVIYDAMYNMYIQGILKTGTQDYDLVENGFLTENQVKEYANGNSTLISAMNAARYAFYADYPEIFYVSFQYLTIRTTKDANNKYHAYLGSGRRANYYTSGFNNQEEVEEAIQAFDAKVNEIVEKAKNIETTGNKVVEQIKLVHNEIINIAGYRLEPDCKDGNEGFLGTPYGVLVKREAVCEGYSRALKTILDKLGINCILVQGVHQEEDCAPITHMWNYVQIEKETNQAKARSLKARSAETQGVWYAIDATLDDPFSRTIHVPGQDYSDREPGWDIVEGFENTRYCLVGTETMNKEHTPLEEVEAAGNYTFKYPELNVEDYGIDTVINNNGLLIKYKQEGTATEEYAAGDYYVSYNGKGLAGSMEDGKYILVKYYQYQPGYDRWDVSPWCYFVPEVYAGGFVDYDDHIYLTMPNSEYLEFAVTTLEPGDYQNDPSKLSYQGDESDFLAKSEKMYNPNGDFKGKPHIVKQTPESKSSLRVGKTYHIDVTYDDDLVLKEGVESIGYRLESNGPTGAVETKIENLEFDGKRRITFDLTFSKMFADDMSRYWVYLTGVVGRNSGKEPEYITYAAINMLRTCPFNMNKSQSWEVFAKPSLLANEDLSISDWKTDDGEPVSEKLKARIALVTTSTTTEEKESMNNLMEEQLPNKEIIKSETYNISLNLCNKYVISTGHKVQISLGFPAGYGPEDEGVTFKAYHFSRDAAGNVTGVDEIPCMVTRYGLIITCDSFSPFAIAVVEKDETTEPQERAVMLSTTDGGKIETANTDQGNIITLSPNKSRNLNIVPDDGYEIEEITVCGNKIDVSNKDSMNITVNYEDAKDGENIVYVTFVAKEVAEKAEERQEVVVEPIVTGKPEDTKIPNFSTTITKLDDNTIYSGNEFSVNVNIHNLKNIEKGLIALGGQLEYDSDILERIDITSQSNWDIAGGFNEENFKFITDNKDYISEDSTIFTIKFKVKESIEDTTKTIIKIKNIVASNAVMDITSEDAELEVEIQKSLDSFTSEIYTIDNEYVTKITAKTTVGEFKENVGAYPNIIIKDKDGNTVTDSDLVATGMTVEVGESIKRTLVVTGDLNGDGEITVTDLAQLKLHYIEKELLTGASLKAADMNYEGQITITDLAKLKLVLIGSAEGE